MNETNWVSQSASPTVTESDRKGLEKAHRYEKVMLKNGYRWYTINSCTKILVECDKDGNPTKMGKQQIKRAQEIVVR